MTLWKWSQTAATNATADSSVNYQEGQSPGSLNNSARAVMAAVAKYRDDISGNLELGGTSTAYTLTTNQGLTALTDGFMVRARVNATSGTTPTLNVDALGAKSIVLDVSATAIPSGALVTGQVYSFVYDSTADGWLVGDKYGDTLGLSKGGTGASLTDPNADRILFWDDSAGAVTWLVPSTGLAISTTNLALSHLGIESLTDPGADRIMFWDESSGSGGAAQWLAMGDGVEISGTTLQANIATQGEMVTGTATDVVVPVGRQHYHPGHPKAWCRFNGAGTIAVGASYNVSSLTDNGVGDYSVTLTNAIADTNAAVLVTGNQGNDAVAGSRNDMWSGLCSSTTSVRCLTWDLSNAAIDAGVMSVLVMR